MTVELGCRMGQVEQMIRYAYWNSGCKGIVIGLSGGIDSAVSAAFCCRAVGANHVLAISMPSGVSNPVDQMDAELFAKTLGIDYNTVNIAPILSAYEALPGFSSEPYLLGNLMARIRMSILYYYANRDNRIVCGTSNRSEYLLGYTTKYGDNAADIQPILHLYKTEIFEVAKELSIPDQIRTKKPSAGLWPGQSDEGEIGLSYAEIDRSLVSLETANWVPATAVEEKVLAIVKKNSHKRLSAPNLLEVQKKLS